METKKLNILIVHNYYQIPGGEDRVAENERALLEAHGHKVFLYTRHNNEINTFGKIQKIGMAFDTVFSPRTYREVRSFIKREQIDIVHVHNTLNLISPSVYYAALSLKIPVVQTMHNYRLLCPAGTFFRRGQLCESCIEQGLNCAIRHKCYKNSRGYSAALAFTMGLHRMTGVYQKIYHICLTEFGKEKLLRLNEKKKLIDEKKIFLKPNFTHPATPAPVSLPFDRKDYYVVIGRLEALKGTSMITKAFLRSGKNLVFVGSGEQLDPLSDMLIKKRINNIHLTGQLSPEETAGVLQGAKALIVGSQWYETFGMTIIEAYSLGIPVIAGDLGAYGSLIKEGVTGYKFRYDSPDDLNDVISRFESAPEDLSAGILREYKENYSPEKNYETLLAIYEHMT